jgi:uncharacterized protein YqhQ
MADNQQPEFSSNGTAGSQPGGEIKFSYGGQAVIEGVMMRGAHSVAIAVRNPKGEIVVHEQPINAAIYRGRISRTPFVRGLVGLWDALGLGMRALMWAADVAIGEEEEVNFSGPIGWVTIAFSLVFGIGLFFLLPTAAASGLESLFGLTEKSFMVNLLEGLVRLVILIGYIWLIGLMADVKRLFGYHGAEHKTINAYEAGAELTPEVVQHYAIEHPRCGTAFLLTVVFVSVLVHAALGRPEWYILYPSRILLIPVIAGIAYEFIRFTARHLDSPIIRFIIIPNLALQHLTTRQPDLHMLEVAIVAFKRVLVSEDLLPAEEATIPEPRPEAVSPTFAASGD